MKSIILFDDEAHIRLLPITYTKPVAAIRIGILTIKEKWEKRTQATVSYLTQDYLSEKYKSEHADDNIYINASLLPEDNIVKAISTLELNQALIKNGLLLAVRTGKSNNIKTLLKDGSIVIKEYDLTPSKIDNTWDIFQKNGEELIKDFELLTKGRKSQQLSSTNMLIGEGNIFVEEGAEVEASIINTKGGPVYIGKNSHVMEGCLIRGSMALCEGSVLKMGAKIYGPSTFGPHSKVGGEVGNSVIQGYSNKGHDGYMGNSVIGEWCNLGADTNTSNLKNNYSNVKIWDYATEKLEPTNVQFCGLVMGDHSKAAINTMFNTATTVGVSANVFGSDFPDKFIPSFSWDGAKNRETFLLDKALSLAENVCSRRDVELTDTDKEILTNIYKLSSKYR